MIAVLDRRNIFQGLVVVWLFAIGTLLPNVKYNLQTSD